MAQYGGYYPATIPGVDIHGQPQETIGGYHDYEDPAGGYDAYAADLVAGDRASTATAPGLAGFGAQSAQNTYGGEPGYEHHDQYNTVPDQTGHEQHEQPQGQYYFDPKQAFDYAQEDAYGGYGEKEQPNRHTRSGSEGSVAPNDSDRTGLKVTNV